MNKSKYGIRQLGQGMTEYIIIVALIAVAAIGVYKAFGQMVRGQTSVAASALGGQSTGAGEKGVAAAQKLGNQQAESEKNMKDFQKD